MSSWAEAAFDGSPNSASSDAGSAGAEGAEPADDPNLYSWEEAACAMEADAGSPDGDEDASVLHDMRLNVGAGGRRGRRGRRSRLLMEVVAEHRAATLAPAPEKRSRAEILEGARAAKAAKRTAAAASASSADAGGGLAAQGVVAIPERAPPPPSSFQVSSRDLALVSSPLAVLGAGASPASLGRCGWQSPGRCSGS